MGRKSKDELARLVKQGKTLEAQDRARREHVDATEAVDKSVEETMRLYASVSPFVRWRWLAIGIVVGAAIIGVSMRVIGAKGDEETNWEVPLSMLGACVPGAVLYLLRPRIGERAVVRETAWVKSRPFALHGYFDALGNSSTEGTASLTITFANPGPSRSAPEDGEGAPFREGGTVDDNAMISDDNLAAIFRTIGGKIDGRPGGRMKKITYSANFGDGSTNNNSHLADFVHQAVGLLETIHAEHPIVDVRVAGF